MTQRNPYRIIVDDATLSVVKAAINVLNSRLIPLLRTLSLPDRRDLPKLGERTIEFVRKAFIGSTRYPDFVPLSLDGPGFKNCYEALMALQGLERELAPLNYALGDTLRLVGSEAYQGALLFFHTVKVAKRLNVEASAALYDELVLSLPGCGGPAVPPLPAQDDPRLTL